MALVDRLALTAVRDDRGLLVAGQYPDDLPFAPVRVFVVSDSRAGQVRGGHAHRTCHQLIMVVRGEVEVEWDDDQGTHIRVLDSPSDALYVPPLVWAKQTYARTDSVLLVLASHLYDVEDYVDDRDEAAALRAGARLAT